MISLCISLDTRPGLYEDDTIVGRYGQGSLNGARSIDFFTEGVRNALQYFRGHETEVCIYVDIHEPFPQEVRQYWDELEKEFGTTISCEVGSMSRQIPHWNDIILLQPIFRAKGKFCVHIDADVSAFRPGYFDIQKEYLDRLDSGEVKFICQPSVLTPEQHGMKHASTRWTIFRKDVLNWDEVQRSLDASYRIPRYGGRHCPCLEHVIGLLAGEGMVDYPLTKDFSENVIFSWVLYHRNTLEKLNRMPYEEVLGYIRDCGGLLGPNDFIGKPI